MVLFFCSLIRGAVRNSCQMLMILGLDSRAVCFREHSLEVTCIADPLMWVRRLKYGLSPINHESLNTPSYELPRLPSPEGVCGAPGPSGLPSYPGPRSCYDIEVQFEYPYTDFSIGTDPLYTFSKTQNIHGRGHLDSGTVWLDLLVQCERSSGAHRRPQGCYRQPGPRFELPWAGRERGPKRRDFH